MANTIINPALVTAQAGHYREYAGNLNAGITRVENAINELVAAVHGEASTKCYEQWNTAKEAMLSYIPKINDVADRLDASVKSNTNLDADLSSGINVEVVNK